MSQSTFVSEELRQAFEEARTKLLDKKLTIDDISRDIRSLEAELGGAEITREFDFTVGRVACYAYKTVTDTNAWQAPVFTRTLVWKRHGEKWRLFYQFDFSGWLNFAPWSIVNCAEAEKKKWVEIYEQPGDPLYETSCVDLKPLIDTSTEIRMAMHPHLPAFVKDLAAQWAEERYADLTYPLKGSVSELAAHECFF
jgi:hypothetical protein